MQHTIEPAILYVGTPVVRISTLNSETVRPPRALECPVQLEATVETIRSIGDGDPRMAVPARAIELRIRRVHVHESILATSEHTHVDPDRWQPLLMSFRKFYGTRPLAVESRLARGPEDAYAPWKLKGLRRLAAQKILRCKYREYRQ